MFNDETETLRARYLRFAAEEARGKTPLYESFALGVAADGTSLRFLLSLPAPKRQPNLLFSAVRYLHGLQNDWPAFRETLLADQDAVRDAMLTHATQTNEPARCATLLPVLARLPQPLALIEVGASAGLCLLPDCYGYDYGGHVLRPASADSETPLFACAASANTPLPAIMPRVAWRAGLDLHPVDIAQPKKTAWLEALVWPGQPERDAGLKAALRIAARERPRVVPGDLLDESLARLCAQAPKDATLVIFHTAVLAYVPDLGDRHRFASAARGLSAYWLSNESAAVFPDIAAKAGAPTAPGRFLLAVNGAPTAWTDPHGAAMEWIEGDDHD